MNSCAVTRYILSATALKWQQKHHFIVGKVVGVFIIIAWTFQRRTTMNGFAHVRAYQSIAPLAERLGLHIEIDERLTERVLASTPRVDWRERLAETFLDLDLYLEGGESSRTAMMRGVAVVSEVLQQAASTIVIVTHGNLMTLVLKYFDDRIGYAEWEQLSNPDVYRVYILGAETHIERLSQSLSSVNF